MNKSGMSLIQIGSELFSNSPSKELKQWMFEMRVYSKLILWPGVFIAVWIIPTINRVQNMITGNSYFALTLVHLVITNLQGFFNVIIYFFNPLKYIFLLRRVLCCARNQQQPNGTTLLTESSILDEQVNNNEQQQLQLISDDQYQLFEKT